MANENPPTKNTAWSTAIMLEDFANPGSFKSSPTLAAGDFKVDIDGAGFGNLTDIPTVTPAAGCRVAITLTAAEMNGDVITIQCIDQTSPKEWADACIVILTTA